MTEQLKQAYNELATKMDERDIFITRLKEFFVKHGYVPEEYKKQWDIARKEGFKSWRCQPAVRKRIMKAAKKAARAKGLEKLTAIEREKGLKMIRGMKWKRY